MTDFHQAVVCVMGMLSMLFINVSHSDTKLVNTRRIRKDKKKKKSKNINIEILNETLANYRHKE